MNVTFDPAKDILLISLKAVPVYETSQIAPGLILDYDEDGNVIGVEIRQASQRVDSPNHITSSVGEIKQDKPPIPDRISQNPTVSS